MIDDWLTRVRTESEELIQKIQRLEAFRGTPEHRALLVLHQDLLTSQLLVMRAYAEILRQRISSWKPPYAQDV
jgi:hypothetical protein